MAGFICPVCRKPLERTEKIYRCPDGHSYDISKSGYINLLMSQKSGNHGDDKIMVHARRDFLEKGFTMHFVTGFPTRSEDSAKMAVQSLMPGVVNVSIHRLFRQDFVRPG